MPLSDLFKKSSPKEPQKDNPFGSPEMQKQRYDAAMEVLAMLQEHFLAPDGKDHAGTVLSTAAWLAGTSLYRSLNYRHNPVPGTIVLSDEVNEEWPKLMQLFRYYCQRNGISFTPEQLVLTPPDEHKPRMEIFQVQEKFQDQYNAIMKKHGLDDLDGARAGMIVCSVLFQYHCTSVKDIDPLVAAGIVSMGIVAGAKTAPLPLGSGNSIDNASEEKAMNNNRLVLGETDAAIQDALDNGGVFVDIHPEVLRTLQAGNIDPYLVYEQALLAQIEKKISRIDFVQADVDQLFAEWKGKPEREIPIHVRLIIWLKNNAKTHGYEQSGNSWVLK